MNGLLDVAKVDEGDGDWTAGYLSESLGCAVSVWLADPCTPTPVILSGSETDVEPSAYQALAFSAYTRMYRRNVCAEGTELEFVTNAMRESSELAAAKVFWDGFDSAEMYLKSTDVATVAAGSTPLATVAAALQKFSFDNPGIEPILHLGITAALSIGDAMNNEGNLKIGTRVAVSAGYPTNGVAVTGPILVRLGTIQAIQSYDRAINRTTIEANRLGTVDFDPCVAVRAITA